MNNKLCIERGRILRLVRDSGAAEGISVHGLTSIFARAGRQDAADRVEEHVVYLFDRGYLVSTIERDQLSRVERWMVRITSSGIDLLDGTIDADPGVNCVV
jgi:hypothetical protein